MLISFYHWFLSLKDSDKIALAAPFIVAILGAIGWSIKRQFDKKGYAGNTIKSPKTTQIGKNNITKINIK